MPQQRRSRIYVLVVDDDDSVHDVTRICLHRKVIHGARIELVSAFSKSEAIEILESGKYPIRAAVVDVVMETDTSGLELVDYIRETQDPHLRIILRTGQAGRYAEEDVMRKYDIDQYIDKTDITPARLWSSVRIAVKYSYDLQSLSRFVEFMSQIINSASTLDAIVSHTEMICQHLTEKYNVAISFELPVVEIDADHVEYDEISMALDDESAIISAYSRRIADPPLGPRFTFATDRLYKSERKQLQADLSYVLNKVLVGLRTLDRRSYEESLKQIKEAADKERLEMIARMTAGVAHEINTPIGVARTAVTFLESRLNKGEQELDKRVSRSLGLIVKNIDRAAQLIKSFKKLSVNSVSKQFGEIDIIELLNDCTEIMHPELKRRKNVAIRMNHEPSMAYRWRGFPGSLSQVIVNFYQNALRYAYDPTDDFVIDIDVTQDDEFFTISFRDHGKGMPENVRESVFEPFMTTGRGQGGTGLGLAITQNLIVNQFAGSVQCESELGQGTTFTFTLSKNLINPDLQRLRERSRSK